MIGIVVPAHNEETAIGSCLGAICQAARHPDLLGEPIEIVVVVDACTDATGILAAYCGASTLTIRARNVGMARAVGAEALLARGARWLSFTDADTVVSPSWLVDQLSLQADAVCGTVGVEDWEPHGCHAQLLQSHFEQTYTDGDGHSHVHGANLGVSAGAYRRAGGFRFLACSEDVALVDSLIASGAFVTWSAKPRVVTSSRKDGRAKGGFADTLLNAVTQRLGAAAQQVLATAPVQVST